MVRRRGIFLMILALALASTCFSASYDLATDWSNESNPNGPWSLNIGSVPLVKTYGFPDWVYPTLHSQP